MKICDANILLENSGIPTNVNENVDNDNTYHQANSLNDIDLGTDRTYEFHIKQEFIDEETII